MNISHLKLKSEKFDYDYDNDDDDNNNNNNNNNNKEIQPMWKVKTRVIPVIIGATGTISKSFRATYQETMK